MDQLCKELFIYNLFKLNFRHYGPYAFSSNGRRTIVARRQGYQKMGQRVAFSEVDLRKINKLYQCRINLTPIETAAVVKPTIKLTANRIIGTSNSIAQVMMMRAAFLKKIRRQIFNINNSQRRRSMPLSFLMTNFGSHAIIRQYP